MNVLSSDRMRVIADAVGMQPWPTGVQYYLLHILEDQPSRRLTFYCPESCAESEWALSVSSAGVTEMERPTLYSRRRNWPPADVFNSDHCVTLRCGTVPVGILTDDEPGPWDPPLPLVAAGLEILFAANHLRANAALRDPLTGLWNRAYLEPALNKAFVRAEQKRTPLSLCLLDIDRFKALNDIRGHLAGDDVLKACADYLLTKLRPMDIAGRWGGDEFYIILPDMDRPSAQRMADRLQIDLRSLLDGVTLSVGVATVDSDGQSQTPCRPLIEEADEELRRAKYRASAGGPDVLLA